MMIYRRNPSQPLKWLVALIIFGLALGVTFDSVDGFNLPGNNSQSSDQNQVDQSQKPPKSPPQADQTAQVPPGDGNGITNPPERDPSAPTNVPEPTTLLLLAGGLGAIYLLRRRKA